MENQSKNIVGKEFLKSQGTLTFLEYLQLKC
jgi:hypothetical protein